MRTPMRFMATQDGLAHIASTTASFKSDGKECWEPSRPIDGGPFWQRFGLAWAVFTGKADALFWWRQ